MQRRKNVIIFRFLFVSVALLLERLTYLGKNSMIGWLKYKDKNILKVDTTRKIFWASLKISMTHLYKSAYIFDNDNVGEIPLA